MDPMSSPAHHDDERARALTPHWLSGVVVWWDDERRVHVLAGPRADPLPGDGGAVHVLTPQDPGGVTPPPEENARLLRDLLAWAAATSADPEIAWRWWPAMGASPGDDHAEHGIVVAGMDRQAAARLGDDLRQLAIYEVTGAELRLVRCRDGAVTEVADRTWPPDAPEIDLSDARVDRWWAPIARALDGGSG